jgi:hypothetical protein
MTWPRPLLLALLLALVLAGPSSAGVRLASRDEPVGVSRVLAGGERLLPVRTAPFRFNLVGLHWRGRGAVSFRTASVAGRWSAWRAARPEAEDLPDRGSREARLRAGWKLGNPYWTGPSRRVQYRLAGQVLALRAHFLWSAPSPAARRLAAAPAPAVVSRAVWGADESIVRASPSYADRVAFAVVHHTAGSSPSTPQESAAIVRGIQAYHVRSNGWNDIGYNFLVDPFGQVFEGRGGGITQNVVGAHAQGFNTGSVGVAVLGTYESSSISRAAREALVSVLAWRLDLAHVDPVARLTWISGGSAKFAAGTVVSLGAVSGHRDVGSTSCPGSLLYRELRSIASEAGVRGLPKLYDVLAEGSPGRPVRFHARLSEARGWTVSVFDSSGAAVASGTGFGTAVDWTWDASGFPSGRYSYSVEAGADVRSAHGRIGSADGLELARLSVTPVVVTPNGDGVGETVRIVTSVTTPASLRLWLEDQSGRAITTVMYERPVAAGTTSVRWGGGTKSGAPVPDGGYRIVAEATSGTERVVRSVSVIVDRTLGHLVARPASFSPNRDGRRDVVVLGFELTAPATVEARIVSGSRPVATLASGSLGPGLQSLSWDGSSAGRRARDGRYTVLVDATTSLGTRRLADAIVLDTKAPRVSRLSASRQARATLVRLRLSERARLVVRVGRRTVVTRRRAGAAALRIRARGMRVAVIASDVAGNTSRRRVTRVRR